MPKATQEPVGDVLARWIDEWESDQKEGALRNLVLACIQGAMTDPKPGFEPIVQRLQRNLAALMANAAGRRAHAPSGSILDREEARFLLSNLLLPQTKACTPTETDKNDIIMNVMEPAKYEHPLDGNLLDAPRRREHIANELLPAYAKLSGNKVAPTKADNIRKQHNRLKANEDKVRGLPKMSHKELRQLSGLPRPH